MSAYEVLEYLPFFAAGYYLFLHPDLFDALVGRVGWNVACVVAFAIALWTIPQVSAGRYVLQALKAAYALSMCALVFWVARRYFDERRPLVRSFSEASYTIYLVHWPVLVLLNRALDAWQVPVGFEFLALTVATGVLSYYFHTLVVARVPVLAFLLNGRTPGGRASVVYRVRPSHR